MSRVIIKDRFGIIQNLHLSSIPQTSLLVGTFFAASYSKTALHRYLLTTNLLTTYSCIRRQTTKYFLYIWELYVQNELPTYLFIKGKRRKKGSDQTWIYWITYVIPDVSGTNAPQPKNGGIDIQNVYAQMAPIILKELL